MAVSKDKNEPGRFLGEGVAFRAKLIGVLEVPEARGDRMCQEALADLKMAIRAAGEHKQRIQVHVAIDGLRLRDDKTGDSLYHHPVHKISFIAQDMTDSRAFGYIFGSPDTGHRFFGIKTDKAASQVVIAMRDLFQVVFELKKKEVELAKQQLEGKTVTSSLVRHTSTIAEPKTKTLASVGETSSSTSKPEPEGGVAELVDLEQELCCLRRGLTQVEGLTPPADPFGDSFIAPPSSKGLLPPPPSGASSRGRNTPSSRVFSPSKTTLPFDLSSVAADFEPQPASLVDNSLPEPTELKNPPKKVLKDLVPTSAGVSQAPPASSLLSELVAEKGGSEQYGPATTMTSLSRHSGGSVSIAKPPAAYVPPSSFYSADPFAETDPFDNTDPFVDSFKDDPFTSMAEFPKSMLRVEDLSAKSKLGREPTLAEKLEKLENSLEGHSTYGVKSVFNGPLQVSLPPEPVPKSPRLQRQSTDSSSIRQRPQPSSKLVQENASPPPPLPPKKIGDIPVARPPPRPPHDHEEGSDTGPPLPRPARKKEPVADRSTKPRLSSQATNSSEDEYLTPAPPPLPSARRFDITLSQLLVCTMPELAARLRVPEATLSSMTLPQLTEYLRSYLAADNERAHINVDPVKKKDKEKSAITVTTSTTSSNTIEKPNTTISTAPVSEFKPQFEDNFAPADNFTSSDTFVANFDDFDIKASASYDRYAAFREIQEQELKSKSILDPIDSPKDEPKQDSDEKEELAAINSLIIQNKEEKELSKSPLKSLDELTLDTFNMFRNSVSPKPTQPIDAKIEDIKSVMKTLQIDKSRRSVSPRENNVESKSEENANDRYAALREITITEPEEFESLPSEAPPKERKKSDEKSDGFDNSDFFDCIDNSSLSFSHVEDAFRKSPVVIKAEDVISVVKEEKKEPVAEPLTVNRETRDVREIRDLREVKEVRDVRDIREIKDVRDMREVREIREVNIRDVRVEREPVVPARLSTGSISDVASGSSPDTKDKVVTNRATTRAGRWAVLGGTGASPWSSDSRESDPRPRRRRGPHHHSPPETRGGMVQTSSSSRDVSPWDEEPPVTRLPRPPDHHRDRESSRHGSSGSRECLDSGSGREKDKRDKRESRDREMSRDGRDSGRDRRDSGSGRDRRDSKERDIREHRDRRDRRSRDRDRDRESDTWERDRAYSERDSYSSRSRDRKEYRDKHRDRYNNSNNSRSYDEEDDYSDGCGSGRSSPRDRWPDQRWRRDERNYGSLGWRESRRRNEIRQSEDPSDRRYGTTLGWPSRRSGSRRDPERDRESRDPQRESRERESRDRDPRRRPRRDEQQRRPRNDYRFSNDFSPREREHTSPFDNDFTDTPTPKEYLPTPTTKKRAPYSSLEATRFSFEPEEPTASPMSACSARARDGDSTSTRFGDSASTRFRFDSDSISPRSMFEDDFTTISTPRGRTASIAEEEEGEVPPLRSKPPAAHRDIKKSESVNIFTRDADPFEGDAFFACTGSDRAARRENWPGDFAGFPDA